MTPEDYVRHDATALAELVARGEVTPDELLDVALAQVAALNPKLNAVVHLREEIARKTIADGLLPGPFRGVPFLLKDLGAEAIDFPSHNGSRLLADTSYGQDSAIFTRIRASGAVTFGRTTSPEGGIGPATEAAVYGGPTRNPWDSSRTPGGSSGGAGAAVAAGIVPLAHGSDGGGSVRIPAASCGLFGFKATRARFPDGPYSGEGWAGMAIDGFLARSVRDAATMMDECQGPDLGAPYFAPPLRKGFSRAIEAPPARLRIGLCTTQFDGTPVAPEVAAEVEKAAHLLENLGHTVTPLRPEAHHEGMMQAWTRIVACGTALSVRKALARQGRELREGDVEGVTRGAIAYAETLSGADYLEAVGQIHAYGRQMAAIFENVDILLSPTLAELPAKIGRFNHETEDYVAFRTGPGGVFAYSPFCAAFNASGQPAASVPLGEAAGLPVGIHLAAATGEDERLLSLCAELEQAAPWVDRLPAFRLASR
ncbi:amidase [Pseudoroseicyclus tamaricis]|uniref:Amidase n=1 Tax=Pseudoroseicyclus tamaricis TaxID=2705421 RepID=A0A6B2JQZ6_9RHOB|nr:amidase [Pseudoroseicyclus tamaricis]NDV00405.1 amidase [Pseudoroseicyclus tamaricis]